MRAESRFAALCLVLALLAGLLGCASWQALVDPAGQLLDRAREALDRKDLDAAYRDLAEIRRRYPDSAESRDAFPLAAGIFQRGYYRDRYARPDSPWLTSEPGFMLDWFASLLEGQTFPQAEAEALFVGMPYGYFRDFLAWAETRPEPSRWTIVAVDDNGIIETVTAEPGAR
jgi:hypothetical protein